MHDFKIGDPIQFLCSSGEWENGIYLKPAPVLGNTNIVLVLTSLYDTLRCCELKDVKKSPIKKEITQTYYKYFNRETKRVLMSSCFPMPGNYRLIGEQEITFDWEE